MHNSVLPPTTERVKLHKDQEINEKIARKIKDNIFWYENRNEKAIQQRIKELDHEWDIERTLEMNSGAFTLAGTILGATINKRWYILPGVVSFFLLQHAVQGWCPPLPILRKFGVRTTEEINKEKQALLDILMKKKDNT